MEMKLLRIYFEESVTQTEIPFSLSSGQQPSEMRLQMR